MKLPLLIACCLWLELGVGCTSRRQDEAKSDFARLSMGGFFASTVYEIKGSRITMIRTSDVAKTRKASRLLSEDEVSRFWRELDSQKVSSWRPSYFFQTHDDRPACSYLSWKLTVRKNSQEWQIRGCDAYPCDRDPRQMIEHKISKRFERVWQSFSRNIPE